MNYKYIKPIKYKCIIFATLFFISSYSQEAENIYHKEYSKLSFVFQPSILKKSDAWNRDGSTYPSMKFTNDFSYQFGVYYNFAQSSNFNFKTGIIAKEFIPKFDLNISKDDVGYGIDYLLTQYDPFSQFIISIPIKTEYFLKLNNKLNISFGAGLNLNLITGTNEEIVTGVSVGDYDGNSKDIFFAKSNNPNSINFSSELSLGVNYKTKLALIDLSFFINSSIDPDYVSGQYEIYNLNQSSDKIGDFIIRNNFYGLSLNVSPKKGWLKRKKLL
ncbi:hypothetical protein FLGE108171_16065 [Flavobacterium gelidilacus]